MSAQLKQIECVDKLGVIVNTRKRIKILIGGRASTKSTFGADYVLAKVGNGQRWCCGREYQNSIDESVHSLLADELDRLSDVFNRDRFQVGRTEITHTSGGKTFYRGLARNPQSLMSIVADGIWIEQGETLSHKTLKVLTASIRASAKQVDQAKKTGTPIRTPEILITMNRGSTADPISKRFLARAEKQLAKTGIYEDDLMLIVQVNYDENPWFLDSGLEAERADDEVHMDPDEYRAKWQGAYWDTVKGSIIKQDWFEAAIDAHLKLNIKPRGMRMVSHDPSDEGDDPKGLIHRHGIVILEAMQIDDMDVNDGMDFATQFAIDHDADYFTWDCDGMGAPLRRQVAQAFQGKKIEWEMFKGSESPDDPDDLYEGEGEYKGKTNREIFKNKRAHRYWKLRDRFYRTWRAVTKHEMTDPDELISIASTCQDLEQLKAETCRIPRKKSTFIQIMSKEEMLRIHNIFSPNISDSLMQTECTPSILDIDDLPTNFASDF